MNETPERRKHPRRDQLTEAESERVEAVFTSHRRFIENVARQHAYNPDAVPDIVQSVGVQVCRGLNGFRGESELRTWLYRVTVNTARDLYRNERRHLKAVDALTAGFIDRVLDPDEEAIGNQRLAGLRDAVERLRPLHRAAIREHLSNQAGDSTVETDQKATTLKSRRHKARVHIREILADDPRYE